MAFKRPGPHWDSTPPPKGKTIEVELDPEQYVVGEIIGDEFVNEVGECWPVSAITYWRDFDVDAYYGRFL